MAFVLALPLRIAQAFIAFLDLILLSYVASHWSNGYSSVSPGEVNFLIFASAWTLLASAYLIVAPMRFPEAAHKFGILAVETLTAIFWFAGWVALAVLLGDVGVRHWTPAQVAAAAAAFAAIEWLLFMATMIMASLHVYRSRHDHSGRHDPAMQVDAKV